MSQIHYILRSGDPTAEIKAICEALFADPGPDTVSKMLPVLGIARSISLSPFERLVSLNGTRGTVMCGAPAATAEAWWSRWVLALPNVLELLGPTEIEAGIWCNQEHPDDLDVSLDGGLETASDVEATLDSLDALRAATAVDPTSEVDAEDGNWPVNVRIGSAEFRADNPPALAILRACIALTSSDLTDG